MMLSVIYQNSSRIYMHGLSGFECLTSVSDIITRIVEVRRSICIYLVNHYTSNINVNATRWPRSS